LFAELAPFARPVLVNGAAGVVTTVDGQAHSIMGVTIVHGKITQLDILADRARVRALDLPTFD
jgi:RNA polymerase sigma-70 factor (ECF subfamily)